MDASLSTVQNLEKQLRVKLPTPPIWNTADPLIGTFNFMYPNFRKGSQPKIEVCIKELHYPDLLARLASDQSTGYYPPYKFSLIPISSAYFDKKKHAEDKLPWSKVAWTWALEFVCKRYDPKKKVFSNTNLRVGDLIKRRDKTKTVGNMMNLFDKKQAIDELKALLWTEFLRLVKENAATYDLFFKYCGLACLHHLNEQRRKIENQMVDTYEAWIKVHPGGIA